MKTYNTLKYLKEKRLIKKKKKCLRNHSFHQENGNLYLSGFNFVLNKNVGLKIKYNILNIKNMIACKAKNTSRNSSSNRYK